MHYFRATIVAAAALAALSPAFSAPVEDRSWPGEVVTKTGERTAGRLQFAREGLLVNSEAPNAKTIAIDQINEVRYHETHRAMAAQPQSQKKVQNGLFGEYFAGRDFQGARVGRLDPTIDFAWSQNAPMPGIGPDGFSVRWRGEVQPPVGGKINFHASSDDGVRLWVAGQKIIDQWSDRAEAEFTGSIDLEAGKRYPIQIEYYDNASFAAMHLSWSGPSLQRAVIPAANLYANPGAGGGPVDFVISGDVWQYRDDGSDQTATKWKTDAGNTAGWKSGPSQLGYGDGDEKTVIGDGDGDPKLAPRAVTTYFRKTVQLPNLQGLANLKFHLLRDDGAVVYVNGVEAFRDTMPAGAINHKTLAAGTVGNENEFIHKDVPAKMFVEGSNVIAVEIHQANTGSSDIGFDLKVDNGFTSSSNNAPAPRGNNKVWLRGGSELTGGVVGADSKWLDLLTTRGVVIRLPIGAIALVAIGDPGLNPAELKKRPPGYLLRNGDYGEGSLKEIDANGKLHTFSALFGRRQLTPAEVRGLKLGDLAETRDSQYRIGLVDAGAILADSITSKGGRLVVRDNSGQFINIPLGMVSEIRGVGKP